MISLLPFPPSKVNCSVCMCVHIIEIPVLAVQDWCYVVWQWPLTIGVAVVTFYSASFSPLLSQYSPLIIIRGMGQEHLSWDKGAQCYWGQVNGATSKYFTRFFLLICCTILGSRQSICLRSFRILDTWLFTPCICFPLQPSAAGCSLQTFGHP